METTTSSNTPSRNAYGAIQKTAHGYNSAREMIIDAMMANVLDEEYCDVDRKHRGSALNHDIYDYVENVVLVQSRHTTCDKYGNHPQKDYWILLRVSGEVIKFAAPHKMAIARTAKLNPVAGHILKKIAKTQDAAELFARFCVAPRMEVK